MACHMPANESSCRQGIHGDRLPVAGYGCTTIFIGAWTNKRFEWTNEQGRTRSCLTLARWAGWSGVQVGRHVKCWSRSNELYPVNRGCRKGARDKVTKRRKGKEGVEWGRGHEPLAKEGWLYLDICVGVPEFQVTPLLMGPVCQRFEEPVRPLFCNSVLPFVFKNYFAQNSTVHKYNTKQSFDLCLQLRCYSSLGKRLIKFKAISQSWKTNAFPFSNSS